MSPSKTIRTLPQALNKLTTIRLSAVTQTSRLFLEVREVSVWGLGVWGDTDSFIRYQFNINDFGALASLPYIVNFF